MLLGTFSKNGALQSKHKHVSFSLKEKESPGRVSRVRLNKYRIGILDQILKVLDEDISVKQIILCFATLSKKSENDIANIIKRLHSFVKERLKITFKNSK